MESSPIELIPHLQTKLPKSYKIGEVSLAQSWAVRITSSALIGWSGHDGKDKMIFYPATDFCRVLWPMVIEILIIITVQVAKSLSSELHWSEKNMPS
jgi:hypothetical protein